MRLALLTSLLIVGVSVSVCAADEPAEKPQAAAEPGAAVDREAVEKAFAEKLTDATLVGSYTIDGQDPGELKTDRYELKRVEKLENNIWHFHARIKHGDVDAVLPIPLTVLWAGDTPVITLTNTMVPGLGTFTVRLMFYGDRYAGTWQHDQVGGVMFGRIEKTKPTEEKPKDADAGNEKPADEKPGNDK